MHFCKPGQIPRFVGFFVALVACWLAADGALAAAPDALRYTAPSGIECLVTDRGLSSVRIGDREVADGGWQLSGAGNWAAEPAVPSVTPPALSPGPVEERSVRVMDDQHARVRHVHANLTVTYDYIFSGEDVHIAARVENPDRKADLQAARFDGLTFDFSTPPDGRIRVLTEDTLRDMKLTAFHPSPTNPIGGSYVADDDFGVGLCPVSEISTPTLLWWQPGAKDNQFRFNYVVSNATKAEGARTYQLVLRLSDRTDWKHLLTPWKRRLASLYGKVAYEPESRPVAYHPVQTQPVEPAEGSGTTLWNCAPGPWGTAKDQDNPLGYAEGEVRFDRAEDVRQYVDRILPALKKAGALGVIFRQLGGYDPKGLEYAAMFHMAPPQVHKNVSELIAAPLRKAGIHMGVTGRPDRWPVHRSIHHCEWLEAEPDVQKHLSHMWACRLRESIRKLGAGMFLMEDFGVGTDDLRLMQFYRRKFNEQEVPPSTFVAHPSDAMLFFSPGVTAARQEDGNMKIDFRLKTWRICRWLVPGAVLYGNIESGDPAAAEKLARFLYANGMGAMVHDEIMTQMAAALGRLHAEFAGTEVFAPAQAAEPMSVGATPPSASSRTDQGSPEGRFTYRTENGIEFLVTADGLTQITRGDRTLAEGSWKTLSPGKAFGENEITSKRLQQTGPRSCRVIQLHDSMRTTFDYSFSGEDLTIRAHVDNNHSSDAIDIVKFGQMTFHFRGEPDKSQWSQHSKWGWLPHPNPRDDLGHMHPGWANRIAGSYGADENYGVGATPLHTGLTRSLTNWKGSWGSADRRLVYSAQKPIPAGAARTFYLRLRLSANRNWKHLLIPYREHFDATHGTEPHYEVDHRLVLQEMVSAPQGAWRSDNNPLGYHRHRRLDTAAGTRRYVEDEIEIMNETGGKGPIIWAQCGYQPRGMLFRSDFDLLPKPVAENWHILNDAFKKAQVRYGVTVGRAGTMNYRWKWDKENILALDPEKLQHVQSMAKRYRSMLERGATMFYLDAFGHRLRSVKAMRYYRKHVLGPDILTYCEHPCDAILPYSGVRTGVRHSAKNGLHLAWGLDRFWYIMNWVMEDFGSQNYSHLHPWPKVKKKIGEKLGNPVYEQVTALTKADEYRWMFRHRMGVMEARHVIGRHAATYRKVQLEFLNGHGQWRDELEPIHLPGRDQYREEREERWKKEEEKGEGEGLDELLEE
jgi:hypothetical protein